MASLQYTKSATLQRVQLGSAYTSGSGTMTLTAGQGAYLPSSGDFWLQYNDGTATTAPTVFRIFKVTARSTDTLTVTAVSGEGNGDGNISSGEYLQWALTVDAMDQLKADIPGLRLLEQKSASSSSSLDFTTSITSTYDEYEIHITNLLPATDAAYLNFRVSTDGGSTYISTSSYQWIWPFQSGAGSNQNSSASDTSIRLTNNLENTTGQYALNGVLYLSPSTGSLYTTIWGRVTHLNNSGTGVGDMYVGAPFGVYKATTAVNAMRFLCSTGNIASGTIRVYGVAK